MNPTNMRAVVIENKQIRLDHDRAVPKPGPKEALIQVLLAGVCATDLAIIRGYGGGFRGILGHEFIGRVTSAPDGPEWVGRRVVGEINIHCSVCLACDRGDLTHCLNRNVVGIRGRDGVFADYLTLPISNLHPVPDNMPDQVALFTEPVAAAMAILQQTHIRPTDRVAVVGDGKLGLLVAQVLALTGCDLLVIGHHPDKWRVLSDKQIPVMLPSAMKDTKTWDLVVECSGSPSGWQLARKLVRARGRLLLKSAFTTNQPVDLAALTVEEIILIGSRCGPFAPSLRILSQGLVQVNPLIDRVYSLNEGIEALTHAQEKGVLKIVIRPS